MPLLANATVSSTRSGAGVLSSASLRIYPDKLESKPIGDLLEQAPLRFMADLGTNIQMGDILAGYNPLGLVPATTYVVRHVVRRDGMLPHLEGTLLPTPNTARLAQYQQVAVVNMPDLCAILRLSSTSDGQGGSIPSYPQFGSPVACRLEPAGAAAQEIPVASALASLTRWMLAVPAGTDIRPSDRITALGATFEVVGSLATPTWEVERHVVLVQIRRQ